MSKIEEIKPTEYPRNLIRKSTHKEIYDQAMQDIMEKAEEFFQEYFYIHPHDCCVVQYVSDKPLDSIDDFVKQFRKSIQIHI